MLSKIQEYIERSFYEALRLVLVAEGYLVDEVPLVGNPNARAIYEDGMKAIANSKGFCIELFGAANNQSRGEKRVPRIVVESERMSLGVLGAEPGGQTISNPLNPLVQAKLINSQLTSNINIALHLVASTIKQDRVLNSIIIKAIGLRKFLNLYDNPGEKFFTKQINYYDIPDFDEGLLERIYEYECPDVFIEEEILEQEIVPIIDIKVEVYLPKKNINNDPGLQNNSTPDGNIHTNLIETKFE